MYERNSDTLKHKTIKLTAWDVLVSNHILSKKRIAELTLYFKQ